MTNGCWVSLVYDLGDEGLPLDSADDPHPLRQVAEGLLAQACGAAPLHPRQDPVEAALDGAEVTQLERVLALLVGVEVVDAST